MKTKNSLQIVIVTIFLFAVCFFALIPNFSSAYEPKNIPIKFDEIRYFTLRVRIGATYIEEYEKKQSQQNRKDLSIEFSHDTPFKLDKHCNFPCPKKDSVPNGYVVWKNVGSCPIINDNIYSEFNGWANQNKDWTNKGNVTDPYRDNDVKNGLKYCYIFQGYEGNKYSTATGISPLSKCECVTIKIDNNTITNSKEKIITGSKVVSDLYKNSDIAKKCSEVAKKYGKEGDNPQNVAECQAAVFNKCLVKSDLCKEYPDDCEQFKDLKIKFCNSVSEREYPCWPCAEE